MDAIQINAPVKSNILAKSLSVVSFAFILFALVIITKTPTCLGYEISIYDAYPFYFWIAIVAPIAIPLIVIVLGKQTYDEPIPHIYAMAGAALLSMFIFLSLPFLRGYFLYTSGDTLSHYGFLKDISSTGFVGIRNIYPTIHIMIYELMCITNFDFCTVSLFFPQIFMVLYVISIFILSKSIGCDSRASLFILAISIIPVFGIELTREFVMPSFDAFCMIPLVLFLLIKSRTSDKKTGYSILLMLILLTFPFFHMETTVFLLVFLLTIYFIFLVSEHWQKKHLSNAIVLKREIYTPLLILLVGFTLWFSASVAFKGVVTNMYNSIFLNLGTSPSSIIKNSLNSTQLNLKDIVLYGVKMYGVPILCFSSSGSLALIQIIKILRRQTIQFKDFMFSILFIVLSFLTLFLFIKEPMYGMTTRTWKYLLFVSVVYCGYYLAQKNYLRNGTTLKILICLALTLILAIAIFTTYPSPFMGLTNRQVTESSLSGVNFFTSSRPDITFDALSTNINTHSFEQAYYGIEKYHYYMYHIQLHVEAFVLPPPPHFGYNVSQQLGVSYMGHEKYLMLDSLSTIYFPAIYPDYPELWVYAPTDFEKLQYDNTINQILDNSGIKLFQIDLK
jgi:hypothetical protein